MIYDSYDQEPEDVFEPLPQSLYCQFYDIEMEDVYVDALFWEQHLPQKGRLLEMGCGSGRISKRLCSSGAKLQLVGLDISLEMLNRLQKGAPTALPVCGDISFPPFAAQSFTTILIPYNTLNLLEPSIIEDCLTACHRLLLSGGVLALQLHIPSEEFKERATKTFQFKIFELQRGGRLIKETLRIFNTSDSTITVEERYRLRPMTKEAENRDYSITYSICGWNKEYWLELIDASGFDLKAEGDNGIFLFHKKL